MGEGNVNKAKKLTNIAIYTIIILSLLVSLMAFFFKPLVLKAFTTSYLMS